MIHCKPKCIGLIYSKLECMENECIGMICYKPKCFGNICFKNVYFVKTSTPNFLAPKHIETASAAPGPVSITTIIAAAEKWPPVSTLGSGGAPDGPGIGTRHGGRRADLSRPGLGLLLAFAESV